MLLWRMFLPPTSADHMAVMSSRLNEKRDRYRSDVNYMYLGGTLPTYEAQWREVGT